MRKQPGESADARVATDRLGPIRFSDLRRRVGSGEQALHVVGGPATAQDVALEGQLFFATGHSGLSIHANDSAGMRDFETRSLLPPALTISLQLSGAVEARLGDQELSLAAREGPSAVIWSMTRPTELVRRVRKGERVRKVNLSLSPGWFMAPGAGDAFDTAALQAFRSRHMAMIEWRPSERAIAAAEAMLDPAGEGRPHHRLALEARALELLLEAFEAIEEAVRGATMAAAEAPWLRSAERARRARDFIEANLSAELSLDAIARGAAMSVSTLQRAFKTQFGETVVEHLRRRRLEIAHDALRARRVSVAEAADAAGYACATSFATAFQRHFGYAPSACRRGGA